MTANLLAKYRQLAGFTQTEAAKYFPIDPSRLSFLEKEKSVDFNRVSQYLVTFSLLYERPIEDLLRPLYQETTSKIERLRAELNPEHGSEKPAQRNARPSRRGERILSISLYKDRAGLFVTDGHEELFSDSAELVWDDKRKEVLSKLIRDWRPVLIALTKVSGVRGNREAERLVSWLRSFCFQHNLKLRQYSLDTEKEFFHELIGKEFGRFFLAQIPLIFPELKRFLGFDRADANIKRRRVSILHAAMAAKIAEKRELKKRFRFQPSS